MRFFKLLTAAMLISTVSIGALQSKSLRNAGIPADFPPSSFKGKQYVDSKGCVFIRAGISGNVTWVPRVSRSRQQVCRQKPTFAGAPKPDAPVVAAARPVAPKPVVKPAPARVVAPKPAPVPKRVVRTPVVKPAPAPAPKRVVRAPVVKPVPAAAPKRVVRAPVVRPAPKRVVRAPVVKPAPTPTPKRVVRRVVQTPVVATPKPTQRRVVQRPTRQVASTCQNASTFSQAYINSGSELGVRCGPQAQDPTGGFVNPGPPARAPRAQVRRVAVPKPTRVEAIAAAAAPQKTQSNQRTVRVIAPSKPPAGYVRVWEDGRQNPNRARGTAAGKAQMEMVWTNTVPRRLIAVSTSQDTRRRIVVRVPRKVAGQVTVVSTKTSPTKPRRVRAKPVGSDR